MIKRNFLVIIIISTIIFALYFGLFNDICINSRIDFERLDQPSVRVAEGMLLIDIMDLTTERRIYSGQTQITQSHNIRTFPIPITLANDYDSYYVQIGEGFGLGLSRYCYENPHSASSISLWVKRMDEDSIGLESYKQTQDNVFRKFEGDALLRVDFEKIIAKNCWVISKVFFVGDHIFKVEKLDPMGMSNSLDESKNLWDVTIHDGSWIKW